MLPSYPSGLKVLALANMLEARSDVIAAQAPEFSRAPITSSEPLYQVHEQQDTDPPLPLQGRLEHTVRTLRRM